MEEEILETQEASEPTMDDTIREGLEKLQEGENTIVEPALTVRQRDDKGKFTKKEEIQEPDTILAPEVKIEDPVEDKPPSSLRKEIQEKWANLDPSIKAEFKKREDDFHHGIEGYKVAAQEAHNWNQALTPYMNTINSFGVSPQIAAQELFKADHLLRYGNQQQKIEMINKLFTDYQIDRETFTQHQQNPLNPVLQQIQGLQAKLDYYEQSQVRQAQLHEQDMLNQANADIQAFSTQEHFETVREDMALLLKSKRAKDLKDAYEQAVWLNPTTRPLMLAKQQTEMKAEAQRNADAAKKAASVNITKKGTLPPKAGAASSMDDTIRDGMRELGLSR